MLIDLIRDIRTYGSVDFTGVLIQLSGFDGKIPDWNLVSTYHVRNMFHSL